MVLTTTAPLILRRMQPAAVTPPHSPAPAPAAGPEPDPLAADVLASIDRIAGMGPSLLVWNECERLRAVASPLAAA